MRLAIWWYRVRDLPWRRILAGAAVALAVIVAVPPLRRAANFAASEHTVFRKLRELLYAGRLEQRYSKEQLLERYLNQVYLGDGNYGIAAAAGNYFGVSPQKLTPAQAATLAGMIHAPAYLVP